jgi:hypothetical protein
MLGSSNAYTIILAREVVGEEAPNTVVELSVMIDSYQANASQLISAARSVGDDLGIEAWKRLSGEEGLLNCTSGLIELGNPTFYLWVITQNSYGMKISLSSAIGTPPAYFERTNYVARQVALDIFYHINKRHSKGSSQYLDPYVAM